MFFNLGVLFGLILPLFPFIFSFTMTKSTIFFLSFSVLLHNVTASNDIKCLQGLKDSFKDPNGNLYSWNFSNYFMGFICKFVGVICWNNLENRMISLSLSNMNLSGQLPDAFKYCSSLATLHLSGNRFCGPIPSEICSWTPYLVKLDLSVSLALYLLNLETAPT